MSPPASTVRPLEDDAQLDAYYRLSVETFTPTADVEEAAAAIRQLTERDPDFDPSQRRAIVAGGTLLGAYTMLERRMRMGPPRLSTACVSAVLTFPEHRNRGVARALMEDAIAHARERGHSLLLLNGIPGFYHRFDFVDVFDGPIHTIDRRCIPSEAPAGHRVRRATLDDAPTLLALYRQHNGPYAGSFDWNLAHMRNRLAFRLRRGRAPDLVEDAEGVFRGYLYREPDSNRAGEVAADTWPAALALLQHHASAATDPPGEAPALCWRLPSDSRTLYLLAEHLRAPQHDPEAPILSLTRHHADAGWMARPALFPALLHGLLPLWQERWERSSRPYRGAVELSVGDTPFTLTLDGEAVALNEGRASAGEAIHLTSRAFTQLVFGYRPVWWLAERAGQHVASRLRPALEVLFPPGGFWLAGTDAF